MSALTNYAENALLNSIPNTLYVKLHTGDPGEDATGNAASNTTRASVTMGTATTGTRTSTSAATWTSVPAAETYSHISLWDASTGGNPYAKGALSSSKTVAIGDTFTIPSGSLSLSLD